MIARAQMAYVAVAGICLVLHNSILVTADTAGIALWAAVLISFIGVAGAGYLLHAWFTFRQPLSVAGLLRYGVAMSANIPLAFVTTWFWHVAVGLAMPWAAPIASVCMVALNYTLGRWAISSPGARRIDTP